MWLREMRQNGSGTGEKGKGREGKAIDHLARGSRIGKRENSSMEDLLHRGIHQREREGESKGGEGDYPGATDLLHRGIQAPRVTSQWREERGKRRSGRSSTTGDNGAPWEASLTSQGVV